MNLVCYKEKIRKWMIWGSIIINCSILFNFQFVWKISMRIGCVVLLFWIPLFDCYICWFWLLVTWFAIWFTQMGHHLYRFCFYVVMESRVWRLYQLVIFIVISNLVAPCFPIVMTCSYQFRHELYNARRDLKHMHGVCTRSCVSFLLFYCALVNLWAKARNGPLTMSKCLT